uniref:Dirigent protein n=1 Tax=Oryza sativa subsp. japonica TaxID=39947 RepID=Q7XPJ1_ORYSJ|nr:OSJNBa0087O24.19 [Oryza sativa Japonica Group]
MAAARFPLLVLCLLPIIVCSVVDAELTHLHFYFHEVDAGTPNATVVNVASLHRVCTTCVMAYVQHVLQELVDVRRRERVGQRAAGGAGPGVAADREGARPRGARVAGRDGRLTAINFVFSDYGAYSGSTLATQGHFITTGPSERSIVGGTGKLRFARGYMTSKLLSSTDTAIVVVFDMYFTLDH